MKVILDANVAIAAAASHGLCESIMELCLEHHEVILCEGILDEIEEKLRKKLKTPKPVIDELLQLLRDHVQILEPVEVPRNACRDPNDLMILGLAVAGHADIIVTGDKDLLVLKEFNKARILSPRAFWESNKQGR